MIWRIENILHWKDWTCKMISCNKYSHLEKNKCEPDDISLEDIADNISSGSEYK